MNSEAAPPQGSTHAGQPHGFVLLVVLAALVVIALLAAAVATVSERVLAEARAEDARLQSDIELFGLRETLLFLLATQRQTISGLTVDDQVTTSYGQAQWATGPDDDSPLPPPLPIGNEIALDSSSYAVGESRFALQDSAGLFSINWTPAFLRAGFFTSLGISPDQWPALEAKRLDYQDPDSEYRLGGAELRQYREANLPPPTNQTLLTPLQLRAVMGWRERLEPLSDQQILDRITTTRVIGLNINTAPASNLGMIPGLDGTSIQRLLDQRQLHPFALMWEFRNTFPVRVDEEAPLLNQANGAGTLRLWNNAGGPVQLLHWTLTPIAEKGRPWRIDYQLTLPRDATLAKTPARSPATPLLAPSDPAGR